MESHVESILKKEEISRCDFNTLQAFLAILDIEESKRKMEENSKANNERLSQAFGLLMGGWT